MYDLTAGFFGVHVLCNFSLEKMMFEKLINLTSWVELCKKSDNPELHLEKD